MSYDIVDSSYNGDTGSTYGVAEINVMRESSASQSYWDRAYSYISDELDRIYQNTSLDGTIARKYDTDADIGCNNLFDDGNQWLDDNGLTGDGSHVWIVGGCDDTHIATSGGGDNGAWDSRTQGFVGENTYPNEHEVAFSAIHEGLHTHLAANTCDRVRSEVLNGETTDDGNSDDHHLGMVYTSWWGDDASVMLGHYGNDIADNGDCDQTAWTIDGYDNDVTDCTLRALELSSEHAAGQH
ncbi:hypothetical protein BRC81_07745 [Halobacteriales archaeon QS_1_68_20]|nr:MAG: hypothetical protein BRC81_07745 [Halobacteriales archaeon QS_1_68_20]